MATRILALVGTILLGVFALGFQIRSTATVSQNSGRSTPLPTPAAPTPSWPNLDRLSDLKNPQGTACGLDGAAPAGTEEAAVNRLRNRYRLPDSAFEDFTLEGLLTLPQGEISPEQRIMMFPTSDSPEQQRAVSISGYVIDVSVLGCGSRAETRAIRGIRVPRQGLESANCYTNDSALCSTQIILSPDRTVSTRKSRNVFVVVITERSRLLARSGLLVSNIGKNWSVETLRKKLRHQRARFSGWLFFNGNYRERAWQSDPQDKIGKPNVRQTAWEIHPVMGIEVSGSR